MAARIANMSTPSPNEHWQSVVFADNDPILLEAIELCE
jgi:hypothetical protein